MTYLEELGFELKCLQKQSCDKVANTKAEVVTNRSSKYIDMKEQMNGIMEMKEGMNVKKSYCWTSSIGRLTKSRRTWTNDQENIRAEESVFGEQKQKTLAFIF